MTERPRRTMAYTRADLQRWKADMTLKRPLQPRPEGLVQGVNIVSFAAGPSGNGLWLQIADGHGEEHVILLNPVVAALLREQILESGLIGGWLDQDGQPTRPVE